VQRSFDDLGTPLADVTFSVLDIETTGSNRGGDLITEIGVVKVRAGECLGTMATLVNPGRAITPSVVVLTGITDSMVAAAPRIEAVLPTLLEFVGDSVIVGHNVGFDMSFLRLKEAQTGVRITTPVLDTLLLDAALHPDHERHSLEAIAERLGVGVVGRHTALGDALVTGEVFVRLLTLLQQRGIQTLGEALAAARATYQARLDARLYGG